MELIRNCGWMGFAVVFVSALGIAVGIAALAVASLTRRFGLAFALVAIGLAIASPATGVLGTILGRRAVEDAISDPSVAPDVRERIRQAGYSEAAQCTALGAFGGIVPGLMAMGSLMIAIVRRHSKPSTE